VCSVYVFVYACERVSDIRLYALADALAHVTSFLDTATSHDLLWQRICCSLIGYFSNTTVDVFVEGVLLNTKPYVLDHVIH